MKIGFYESDITPRLEERLELSGYGYFLDRKAEAVLDEISASAVVIEGNNGKTIGLASLDLVGLSDEGIEEIYERVKKKSGIDKDDLLISCTHTHSAPSSIEFTGLGEYNRDYVFKTVIPNSVDALTKAKESLRNGRLGFNFINVDGIGYNRASDSGLDTTLALAVFENEADKAAMLNYPCHPVVLSGKSRFISGDYPGWVRKLALKEKRMNLDMLIWTTGCCGDINPLSIKERGAIGKEKTVGDEIRDIYDIAEKIVDNANAIYIKTKLSTCDVATSSRNITFSLDADYTLNPQQEIDNVIKKYKQPTKEFLNGMTRFLEIAEQRINDANLPNEKNARVTAVRLGDQFLLGLPGEIFSSTGLKIKARYPNIFIMTYTNGVIGYIPPEEEFNNPSSYAAGRGQLFYNHRPFTRDCESRLLKTVDEVMADLR